MPAQYLYKASTEEREILVLKTVVFFSAPCRLRIEGNLDISKFVAIRLWPL